MFLSLSKDERALFSSVVVQLKRMFPILCKYKEPNRVSQRDLLAVLTIYAKNNMEKKAYKVPRDFQSSQQRINFN